MRRRYFRLLLAATVAATVGVVALVGNGTAGAQTTPTTSAPVPTTLAPVVTTVVPTPTTTRVTTPGVTTAPGSTVATTATTATTAPATIPTRAPTTTGTGGSDGGGFPWLIVLLVVVVAAAVGTAAAVSARRRGARRQLLADWLREAADTTAEAGATVRLLAQGTPLSGPIAQQLVASLRAFDDLALRAPDEGTAADAERARRTLQNLGIVIDRAYRLRRSQPPPEAWAIEQSEEAVRSAALDTDRTLRTVYRGFTAAD
jgi:hypothetical protein